MQSTMPQSPWVPILEGEHKQRAEDIIRAVAKEIVGRVDELCKDAEDATLVGGTTGVALAAAYIRRWDPALMESTVVETLLAHGLASTTGRDQGSSLFFGALGPGWVAEHLRAEAPSQDAAAFCDELDELIANGIGSVGDWRYQHELFTGLVGVAVYLIEREDSGDVSRALQAVGSALVSAGDRQKDGTLAWRTHPRKIANPSNPFDSAPYYNLGVPHGAPGAMSILSQIAARDAAWRDQSNAAVAWLLNQRATDRYPCFGMVGGHKPHPRWLPVAWCYGDLGIVATLATAAVVSDRSDWLESARLLARKVAQLPMECEDTSLCHGSAGNAHMFARLFQFTGDDTLRLSAIRWFEHLIRQWEPQPRAFAGFRSSVRTARSSAGFLRGAAGAALALLGAVSEIDPAWDRLLILSPKAMP